MKANSTTDGPNLVIDLSQREIRHNGGPRHKLSRLEYELLAWLMGRAGQTVSRAEIISRVWRLDPMRTITRTVDMHVSMLRKKLGEDSRNPSRLVTIYRVGYMMLPAGSATAVAHN
jgi:DNA-binding response OmpR family regulator